MCTEREAAKRKPMIETTKAKAIAIAAVMLVMAGCSHTYVPKESKYSSERIPTYKVVAPVSLQNEQPRTEKVLFAANMGHKFYANYHDWTDKAIAIANRELVKRGAKTNGSNAHVLKLKVSSVQVTTGTWGFRGFVTLDAALEDGSAKTLTGEAPGANIYNVASGALSAAITKMLSDPEIIAYLAK